MWYLFPNSVMLWTFMIFFINDAKMFGLIKSLENNAIFIGLFLVAIIFLWKAKPRKRGQKARAIAYNVAVLPFVFINMIFMSKTMSSSVIHEEGIAYLTPMLYSPIIFIIVFSIVWLILFFQEKP